MLWGGLNYWLYAKPDVVNRWLRGDATDERRLGSRCPGISSSDFASSKLFGFCKILSGTSIDLFQNYDFLSIFAVGQVHDRLEKRENAN